MKVCHFITNPYSRDTRVIKEAESLRDMGFSVDVVCYWRDGFKPGESVENGVRVVRTQLGRRYLRDECLRPLLLRVGRGRFGSRDGVPRWVSLLYPSWWRRQIGRVVGRLRPKRAAPDSEAQLRDALATEIRFSPVQRLMFWTTLLLSPLLIVLGVVAALVRKLLAVVRLVARIRPRRKRRLFRLPESVRFMAAVFSTRSFSAMLIQGWLADADVYQANDPDTLLVAWMAARLRGAKFVYDSHELFDESFPRRKQLFVRMFIRKLEGRFSRRADHVFTVNDNIARVLQARYGLAQTPTVVRNAQPQIAATDTSERLREVCNDPHRKKILFVYAGRVTRGRGLEQAIDAWPGVDPRAVLIIMGGGEPRIIDGLKARIARLDLAQRVFVIDPVPSNEVATVLSAADVGLMLTESVTLSSYYGLGNKLFHYVISGIPVIVPDHPEKRAVIEEHGVGWWVESLDPEALAQEFNHIVADPADLDARKQHCRAAAPQLSWEHEGAKYRAVFVGFYEQELFRNDVY